MSIKANYAYNLSLEEWKEWTALQSLPAFAGAQIYQWIYQKNNLDPMSYSNLSKECRDKLMQEFTWDLPIIDTELKSKDGSTKYLLKTFDGLLIEMVLMPYEGRTTLCISSQVGCKMGCTFCQTGKLGLKRNLSSGEILGQILLANQLLGDARVSNIVFMGMGEPLDNYDEVVKACRVMIDEKGLGLSKTRVTVSTAGVVPKIAQLGQDLPVRLAISLHQTDEEKRSAMMPINRTYSLKDLKEVLLNYPAPKRYGITFEYVMIEGKNDSIQDAKRLVHFLHGLKAKVNLIPVNHFPGMPMRASHAEAIRAFQTYLTDRSIPSPVRYSRGQDVSGGCGQLAAKKEDELDLDPRLMRRKLKVHQN